MTHQINKLSVQSLNALFTILEQQPQSVLWIRSRDFQRQLYVNENYQTIWHRQPSELYQHPNTLIETLYPIDRDAINQQLATKNEHHLEQDNVFFYRIITPDGHLKFVKDWHYLLTDNESKTLGYAGLAQDVTPEQWTVEKESYKQRLTNDPKSLLQRHVFDILQNELHIQAKGVTGTPAPPQQMVVMDNNNQGVVLSRRELQVIQYLREGMTAKQTANEMHVSARTVEFHLNNIKDKVGCKTKLELLSRIQV